MLDCPQLKVVGTRMVNHYLKMTGEQMGPEHVLETWDRSGITHRAIYK
jgi:hypothetical protein